MDGQREAFDDLLSRARAGDRAALGELYQLYHEPILQVIRRKLHSALRRRYDSVDFSQSVWTSFVQMPLENFTFATPDDLIAFLSRIAYNKVGETTRRRLSGQKHNMTREVSLDAPPKEPIGKHLPDHLPTPSQYVIADECWQKILRGLSASHVRVVELLRDGHSATEISTRLDIHPKVIQRLLDRLRHHVNKE